MNTHSLDLEAENSQYASIADASQSGLDLSGDFTIEAWIKPTSNPSHEKHIVDKFGASGQYAYRFFITTDGDFLILQYSGDGTNVVNLNSGTGLFHINNYLNRWVHIAVVVTPSSRNAKFYINGILLRDVSAGSGATSVFNSSAPFSIGTSTIDGSANRFFDGLINNVSIYNDIRTAQEIKDNMFLVPTPGVDNCVDAWTFNNTYNSVSGNNNLTPSGSPTFSIDVPFPEYTAVNPVALGDTTLAEEPISYWKLDGNSNDSIGSNNGTDTSITYSGAKFGDGADFNGTTSMINVGSDNSLNLTSALTVSAWIYATGWGENNFGRIFQRHSGSTGYMFYLSSSISGITFNAGGDISSGQSIELNKWQFVVATFSGGTARIYVNGILVAQASGSISSASGVNGIIGNRTNNSGDRTFDGIIDDVAIFDRALTPTEIFELYTGLNKASNIKYFNGAEWVGGMKKVFDGSAWKDATINTF